MINDDDDCDNDDMAMMMIVIVMMMAMIATPRTELVNLRPLRFRFKCSVS